MSTLGAGFYRRDSPAVAAPDVIRRRGFHVLTLGVWLLVWGRGTDNWTKAL